MHNPKMSFERKFLVTGWLVLEAVEIGDVGRVAIGET